MLIVIRFREADPRPDAIREVSAAAGTFAQTLRPLHAGTADPQSSRYFAIDVPDEATATRILANLRACPAVDGAYSKPPDAMP